MSRYCPKCNKPMWWGGTDLHHCDHTTGEDYSRSGKVLDVYGAGVGAGFKLGLLAGILIGAGLTCAVWMWL